MHTATTRILQDIQAFNKRQQDTVKNSLLLIMVTSLNTNQSER
jgi:hypothetical protein